MRLVVERQCAYAAFQCCGIWLHCRGTVVALLPEWWWQDRNAGRRPSFKFGVKLWAWDHNAGVHTVFGVCTRNLRLKYQRAFAGRHNVSEGVQPGWSVWRRKPKETAEA